MRQQHQRFPKSQGEMNLGEPPSPPVPSPGSFSAGSTALIIFNEDFQVLPGNYPQEAYCRAGARTQHEQTRWQ